jgi:hypothetical protein
MQPCSPGSGCQIDRRRAPWGRAVRTTLAGLLLIAGFSGCSLVSLKSPERPLSTRDMSARVLTRELSTHFLELSARTTDNILATESDPIVIEHTLRWELGVIDNCRRAESQLSPMMSLLDTWALALQLQAFAAEGGPGARLFGTHQAAIRELTDNYADGAQSLAKTLLSSKELADYQGFVTDYVHAHPLSDLRFTRASVLTEWSREKGTELALLDEVGTIPQALADGAQRVEIYGNTVPQQAVLRTQLLLRQSGYSQAELRAALARLDDRVERLTSVAENAPELVRDAAQELRASLRDVFVRLDASARATVVAVHTERLALFEQIQEQREALIAATDAQRKALTADAARIADQLVRASGEEVRHFTREAVLLFILLALVLLGLPFAAGYLVGRARSGPHTPR